MRNLSELSLKNRDLVWYFIIVVFLAGIFSYFRLGRMEDPDFTIREMIVSASWPGASADQMEQQVTDKLERKLQETKGLDFVHSFTRAGTSVIYVTLRDDAPKENIQNTWKDVRNACEDIKSELPEGVYGPYYDDRFDDVYGSVYALTGDGYSYEELRQKAEEIRRRLTLVDNVQRVELLGDQTEKVYVEVENSKLAELGINPQTVADALQTQNEVTSAGKIDTQSDNVYVRYTGMFNSVEEIKNTPINAGGKVFRLGDIAKVERRSSEPAEPKMYFNGQPAVGIEVSMKPGGNIIKLGEELNNVIAEAGPDLPAGMELQAVSDQPDVVANSISEFVRSLLEAVVIVLAVSFLSLGWRTGMVVAGCIPLVLTGVFLVMYLLGIDLQKVSLGALIISLGLLVDDAIIAVEMMSVQLERGLSRFDAACYAFRATAKPMLTGTLITCAGFIPVAFSEGMAAEFCSSLFPVISTALLLSWIVSVMVAPLFGTYLIRVDAAKIEKDPYDSKFYQWFRKVLVWFLSHKKLVLISTAGLFAASIWLFDMVREEFFPPSLRPEILVGMRLPQGASLQATDKEAKRFAAFLAEHSAEYKNYSYYVGTGAPRFVLTVDPELDNDNYAQFVVVADSVEDREKLAAEITEELETNFPEVRGDVKFIQTGPPAAYPVMLRVKGPDKDKVREIANKVADQVAADDNNYDVNLDWNEKSKTVRLEFDQDKLKAMGTSAQTVAQNLHTELTGVSTAQYYSGDRTIDIVLRSAEENRTALTDIKNLPVYLGQAGYVPLSQIAKVTYAAEDGLIWRRDLLPTITVQANIHEGTANDATQKAYDNLREIRESLPAGYSIEPAGALEDSDDSLSYIAKPVPMMIFCIATLLMFQLRSVKQMVLTLLTAPLGLIGVSIGMLIFDKALGFVAILGVLALSGMIIRNSVILIDQIQQHLAAGETPWDAVVDSAVLRFRPIMLTAAAAVLGMIPLMRSIFWGPMAVAIASGLVVATVLTLLVLPAMYAAWYHVEKE